MPDWKQELRNVLKDANRLDMVKTRSDGNGLETTGEPPIWTFQMTDERMKELEAMNLWTMEGMND